MEKLVLSVAEAAEIVGVSRSFLYERVQAGELESYKLGRLRKIPRVALDRWLQEQAEKALV